MRLLVARPEPGAARTAERLAAMGHAAIIAPVLRLERTDSRLPEGRFDAIALTSPNAADLLEDGWLARQDLPVFAVGPRTAEAARATGAGQVIDCAGDARSLAAEMARRLPQGTRVLHPAGAHRAADLGQLLAPHGIAVATEVIYRMSPVTTLHAEARDALARRELDGVLHFSPRSAATLWDCVAAAGVTEPFTPLMHFCLSQAVAAALEMRAGRPMPRLRIAARPDEDALLALLAPGEGGGPEVAPRGGAV